MSSQGYGFSSGHVWMWDLDCEESWVPKNWCFWSVVLEKTLESPLECKEIQPVHSEGDQPWDFFGRNDAKAETPILWPPHEKILKRLFPHWKRLWCWEGLGQEEKGTTEDGWHHWLDGCESEWTPAVGDEQGGLACCDSWGREESDMTQRLNWTESIYVVLLLEQEFTVPAKELLVLKEWKKETLYNLSIPLLTAKTLNKIQKLLFKDSQKLTVECRLVRGATVWRIIYNCNSKETRLGKIIKQANMRYKGFSFPSQIEFWMEKYSVS